MTQLLIRLFVRHPDDTKNAAVRTAYGNLASLVGICLLYTSDAADE